MLCQCYYRHVWSVKDACARKKVALTAAGAWRLTRIEANPFPGLPYLVLLDAHLLASVLLEPKPALPFFHPSYLVLLDAHLLALCLT